MVRSPFKCEIPGCDNDDATDQCESCSAWLCSLHAFYFPQLGAGAWCKKCGQAETCRQYDATRPARDEWKARAEKAEAECAQLRARLDAAKGGAS